MTKFGYLAALLLALTFASSAHAQLFYNNDGYPGVWAGYLTTDEIADDTPFTGTQHVASFTFFYVNQTAGAVSATVRFYGVNPTTGGAGSLIATVPVTNLLPNPTAPVTVALDASQQFDWTAQPGIYGLQTLVGGFVSFQFSDPQSGWWEAGPVSYNDFYDLTTGQRILFQDTNASFYLQMSTSTSPVTLTSIYEYPPKVKGGTNARARVTLSGPAPAGGLKVSLFSSNPKVAKLPVSVTVPQGATTANVVMQTRPVQANTNLVIWGSLDGENPSITLVVTP
jgi:hypothetical protein